MAVDCEKCQAVLDYIEQWQSTTHGISFEAEKPIEEVFKDIKKIIASKTPLEQAYEQAKRTGTLKQLLKARRNQL